MNLLLPSTRLMMIFASGMPARREEESGWRVRLKKA